MHPSPLRPADATTWATTVPPDELDPGVLEAHVAWDHGQLAVAADLGVRVRDGSVGDGPGRVPGALGRVLGSLGGIFAIVVVIAPIGGVAAFLTGADAYIGAGGRHLPTRELEVTTQIWLAGVCFWVAVLGPLYTLSTWWRNCRYWESFHVGIQLMVIVPAVVSLIALDVRDVDVWDLRDPYTVPIWISLVLSIVAGAVISLFSRRVPPAERPVRLVRHRAAPRASLTDALAEIDAADRAAMLTTRDAALDILRRRGLLDDAQHARALRSQLGELTW